MIQTLFNFFGFVYYWSTIACLCLTAVYAILWILEDFYMIGGSWVSDSFIHLLMSFTPVVNTILVVFGIWYILIWPYKTIKNHFTKESPNG